LEPCRAASEHDVGDSGEPCCAAADGGAVESEDENFLVVDH
jgi:hypothetical protein